MSERIKELIESLGIIPEDEHYQIAELIIRECAELVEYNSKGAGRDIREHFGVNNG